MILMTPRTQIRFCVTENMWEPDREKWQFALEIASVPSRMIPIGGLEELPTRQELWLRA